MAKASPGLHFVMECHTDHLWRWRLMENGREVIAMGVRGYKTKRECREVIQRLVSLKNVPIISQSRSKDCAE